MEMGFHALQQGCRLCHACKTRNLNVVDVLVRLPEGLSYVRSERCQNCGDA